MELRLEKVFACPGEWIDIDYALNLGQTELYGTFPFQTPVCVKGKVQNRNGLVELTAHVDFTYSSLCDRCATETNRDYSFDYSHTLVSFLNHEDNDELILVEDNLLDLDQLVLSDVLLSLPSKYLCKPDCAGVCPQCGQNLNRGSCDCDSGYVDPRLSVLGELSK